MIRRLRRKFIRIATLSVAAVMLLLTLILNAANFISIDLDLRQTLTMISENQGTIPHFSAPGSQPAPDGTGRGPAGLFTPETPFSTRFFVLRYQDDGTLTQAELSHIASVTEDDLTPYLAAAAAHGEGYHYYSGYKYYVVHLGDDRNMAIFLDCFQEVRSIRTVLLWSVVASASCILLVFWLVVVFSGKAIEPVVRSSQQQKQFITDASHELKTPITVIATSLKVLEMETGKQKWIDKSLAQTEKLTALVNSLVTLSRMDEENSPLKMADFAVSDAVEDTVESFRDFAGSKDHALQAYITPGLTYHGDEKAVRQLVSILLDNAVKYALPGTEIRVSLKKSRRGVTLRTENACEPMPQETADKLFDRFYRADPSRNAATGGFGIGLSIARSIAEGHRGTISAHCSDGHIAFTAELN